MERSDLCHKSYSDIYSVRTKTVYKISQLDHQWDYGMTKNQIITALTVRHPNWAESRVRPDNWICRISSKNSILSESAPLR